MSELEQMMEEAGVSFEDIVDDAPAPEPKKSGLAWQLKQLEKSGLDKKGDGDGGGGASGASGAPQREFTWEESHRDDYEPDL